MIRCRVCTALHKSPEEVGAMDYPDVMDLLNYWVEYPPEHLLLRGYVGYEGKKKSDRGNWRKERARELRDDTFKEPEQKEMNSAEAAQIALTAIGMASGATKKLDCAPPHIQEAIQRMKRGEHLEIPKPE